MKKIVKVMGMLVLLIGVISALEISIDRAKFDPLKQTPNIPQELKASADNQIYILQCKGPIKREWRGILSQDGVKIYGYIPHYAFIVRISPSKIEDIKSLEFIRWIGPYHPYYKIATEFENLKKVENKSEVYVKGKGFVQYQDPLYIDQFDLKSIVIYCLPDANMQEVAMEIQKLGIEVKKVLGYPSNRIIAWTSLKNLNSIAKIPEVYYIYPYYPKTFFNNTTKYVLQSDVLTVAPDDWPDNTADTVTAGSLPVWDNNIKGQGQIITVFDTGVDYYSCWFIDPEGDPPGPNHIVIEDYTDEGGDLQDGGGCYHGTHVTGTVAGDPTRGGANTIADYQGHAYMGRIYMQDIGYYQWPWGCLLGISNFYNSSVSAYNLGSRIHTNSWGYTGANGSYQYEAIDIDVFSFANQGFLYTVAAGNGGPSSGTIQPPSTAKNCISVGSTYRESYDASADNLSDFSSRGPTNDNRYKPDLTAPGGTSPGSGYWREYILSAYPADNWGTPTCRVAGLVGTSMATPAVAACAALVRQYYEEGWYPSGTKNSADAFNPSGALVKATLLLSTVDMTGVTGYPNYDEGWGRILLDNALYFSGDARELKLDDHTAGLTTGQQVSYPLTVTSSSVPLKIVLVWHDTAAAAGANPTLVNDLNLRVTDPNGNTYWGNNFSGGESQPGGSPDSRNNVEIFLLNNPPTGSYTVSVIAQNVATAQPQPYAITVSGQGITLGYHEAYTQLNAEILSSGIKIIWNSYPDILYYEVYRKENEHRSYKFISKIETNSFIDKNVEENTVYWYNVKGYSRDGKVIKDYGEIKVEYRTKEPISIRKAPTITRGENIITYELSKEAFVVLKIYDITGKLVRRIIEGRKVPGVHKIYWNGKDEDGKKLPSGKYFYVIFADKSRVRESFLILR